MMTVRSRLPEFARPFLPLFLAGNLAGNLAMAAEAAPPELEPGSEVRVSLRNPKSQVQGSLLDLEQHNGIDALRVLSDGDSLTIPRPDIQKLEIRRSDYTGQEVKAPVLFGVALAATTLGFAYWAGSSVDGSVGLQILAGVGGAMGGMFVFGKFTHELWPVHNAGEPRWKTVPFPVSSADRVVPDATLRVGLRLRY